MSDRSAHDPPPVSSLEEKHLEKASTEVVALVLSGAADVFDDPDIRYQPMTGAAVAIALRRMAENLNTERSST